MEYQQFQNRLIKDLREKFEFVILRENNNLVVGQDAANVTIPTNTIFHEYQSNQSYKQILDTYTQFLNQVLSEHKFKIDYSNVYPILKHKDFGTKEPIRFYRDRAFCDIDILYVSNFPDCFRFVLADDEVDIQRLITTATQNIDRMANALVKLDDSMEIYVLKYSTDFATSFLISPIMQKMIEKKVGKHYYLCIPSATAIIIAKPNPSYIPILEALIAMDNDPHRVSDYIYRFREGEYSILR